MDSKDFEMKLQIGTGHIGPHLYLCVIMDIDSRCIIAFRFGKSNSDKLKQSLCADLGIEVPQSSRIMSSFFSALSAERMLLYRCHDNDERIEAAAEWIDYYNTERLHSSIGYKTPSKVYEELYGK